MHAEEPWVRIELSPLSWMALDGSDAKNSGTGARRIMEPLPARCLSLLPQYTSCVSSCISTAARVMFPMSKHLPLWLM